MSYDDWSAGPSRAPSLPPSHLGGSTPGGSGSRSFLARLGSVAGSVGTEAKDEMEMDAGYGDDGAGPGEGAGEGEEGGVFSAADLSPGPEEGELDDVRRLGRVLTRERGTPGILEWEGELLDSLLDKLEQQGKMMATLRADPATSEEEHFRLVLVQTEMERAKFLVRSYVRTRLHKIEKFAQHINDTPELHARLSGAELQHARRYAELVATHFAHSALDSLPEWLRGMDDTHGGLPMVATPNHAQPVLVYCRRDCGEIPLEGGEIAVLGEGTTHLVRYDYVERWIALGWAEVL